MEGFILFLLVVGSLLLATFFAGFEYGCHRERRELKPLLESDARMFSEALSNANRAINGWLLALEEYQALKAKCADLEKAAAAE